MDSVRMPNSSTKTITLPDRQVMLERLKNIERDDHIQEKMFPKLLDCAGKPKVSMGVVLMLESAIHDYTEKLPPAAQWMTTMYFSSARPKYLEALIVDDPESLSDAQNILNMM